MNKPILLIYHNEKSVSLQYFEGYNDVFYACNNTIEIRKAIIEIINFKTTIDRDISKYYCENLGKKYFDVINQS